jgi:mercuric ion binding protein
MYAPKTGGALSAVNFDKRTAVVAFDDARTSLQKLTRVTEGAGTSSSLKQCATQSGAASWA